MLNYTLYYSEGSGTSKFEVGQFYTIQNAMEYINRMHNSKAVWTIKNNNETF